MNKILFNKALRNETNHTNFVKTIFEGGEIGFATIDEIYSDFPECMQVDGNSKYTEKYREAEIEIVYNRSWLCGYVYFFKDPRDKYPLDLEKFLEEDEEGKKLYIPHGGYTAKYGFDCCHISDVKLNKWTGKIDKIFSNIDQNLTFKSFSFVLEECRKIVDSLRKIEF